LQGTWYIAGTEITSNSQTIIVTDPTVTFKFVKTAGVEDERISCTVVEGGATILTLTLTTAATWEGSYTFAAGTHSLTVKAYDGTTTISFSIVGLEVAAPPAITITPQLALILLGIAFMATSAYTYRRRKGGL
jgi:hypothetical protein